MAHTPDGAALVYSSGHVIERIPVGGGEPQVLARPELPPGASLDLRFSLDGTGRHLLYVHGWKSFRADLSDGSTASMPIEADGHSRKGGSPRAAW